MLHSDQLFTFDFEFIQDVYNSFKFSSGILIGTQVYKALLMMFIVFWAIERVGGRSLKDLHRVFSDMKAEDLFKLFWVTGLLISYDVLLEILDLIGFAVDQEYSELATKSFKQALLEDEITTNDSGTDNSWTSSIIVMSKEIVKVLSDPFYITLILAENICYVIDWILYGLFLTERFFMIWTLKLVGGIAIVGALHKRTESWFKNWLGLYISHFLIIIPYIGINWFASLIYEQAYRRLDTTIGWLASGPAILILLLVVILKLKLFKKSLSIVNQVFS